MAIIRLFLICILLTTSAISQGLSSYQKTNPIYTETSSNLLNVKIISDTTISGDTLKQNEEWSGNITVTGEIVVPDSITLMIDRGTNIYFSNNNSLKSINGVITTHWSWIQDINIRYNDSLENRGYLVLEGPKSYYNNLWGIKISQGGGIQCLNGAYAELAGVTLDSCWDGIYMYNAYVDCAWDTIREPQYNGIFGEGIGFSTAWDVITKTTSNGNYQNYQGIFLTNISANHLLQVDVSGFCWGIYLGSWSYSYTDMSVPDDQSHNNRFRNNEVGVGVGWGSSFDECEEDGSNKNSVYNNLYYDIFCYTGSIAKVSGNYWGGDNLSKYYCDSTSFILGGDNYLENDPWAGLFKNNGMGNNHNNALSLSHNKFKQLEQQGRMDEEINYYQSQVKNGNNSPFALSQLCRINRETPTNALSDYFRTLLNTDNKNHALIQKIVADDNLHKNEFEQAMSGYDKLIAENLNDFAGIDARFEKLFAFLHIKHDTLKAVEILSEIKAIGSKDIEVGMRTKIAENLLRKNNYSLIGKTKDVPRDYLLSQNYPNPFNPSTTINYQLPRAGIVTLKVYDILGKEVTTLVNEFKQEGIYSAKFDASKLPSGVYVYRIKTNNFISSKKMMILK